MKDTEIANSTFVPSNVKGSTIEGSKFIHSDVTGSEGEDSTLSTKTDEEVEKSKVVPNEVTGAKTENSQLIASVTTDNQRDIMDQHYNTTESSLAILRNMVQPPREEIKRVDARLRRLHCNSGHCSNRTLADGSET